jgi:hypothetical protein
VLKRARGPASFHSSLTRARASALAQPPAPRLLISELAGMRAPPPLRCLRVVRRSSHAARPGRRRAPRRVCPFRPQRTSRRDLGCARPQAFAWPRFEGAARAAWGGPCCGCRTRGTHAQDLNGAWQRPPCLSPRPAAPPRLHLPRTRGAELVGAGRRRALGARRGENRPLRVFCVHDARASRGSRLRVSPPRTRPRTWASREPGADVWWRGAGRRGGRPLQTREEWLSEWESCRARKPDDEEFYWRARATKNRRGPLTARGRPPSTRAAARRQVAKSPSRQVAKSPSRQVAKSHLRSPAICGRAISS